MPEVKAVGASVIVVSDTHVGSTVALWPKNQAIQDGGIVQLNVFQKWLLRCWEDMIEQVGKMNKPILILNGDLVQGIHGNRDAQLVSALASVQAEAAEKLLRPLVAKCRKTIVIRGTEFHDGRMSEHVERLAAALGAEVDPETGHYTRWELYLDCGGPVINVSHHVATTSVPAYESTLPTREALMLISELTRFYGPKAPNVRMVVRSHRHRYVQVHLPPDISVVVTPSWQLRTAYSYRKASSMLPEIGWIEIRSEEGHLTAVPHLYPLPRPRVEKVID